MRKILFLLVLLMSFAFSANTNWTGMRVADNYTRTIPMALGASLTTVLATTNVGSITLNVVATTGRNDLPQIMSLSNVGTAVSTIDVVVVTNMTIGDIVYLQTALASEDVVVSESALILLGATSRTLSDPADILGLQKFTATKLREVLFIDNN